MSGNGPRSSRMNPGPADEAGKSLMAAAPARHAVRMVARHGRDSNLNEARAAQRAKWIAEVDPDGTLSPEELAIRLGDRMRVQVAKMQEGKRRAQLARQAATEHGGAS